jgi:hypothetical protein
MSGLQPRRGSDPREPQNDAGTWGRFASDLPGVPRQVHGARQANAKGAVRDGHAGQRCPILSFDLRRPDRITRPCSRAEQGSRWSNKSASRSLIVSSQLLCSPTASAKLISTWMPWSGGRAVTKAQGRDGRRESQRKGRHGGRESQRKGRHGRREARREGRHGNP